MPAQLSERMGETRKRARRVARGNTEPEQENRGDATALIRATYMGAETSKSSVCAHARVCAAHAECTRWGRHGECW